MLLENSKVFQENPESQKYQNYAACELRSGFISGSKNIPDFHSRSSNDEGADPDYGRRSENIYLKEQDI